MRVIVRTVGWTQKGGRRRRKKVNKVHEEVKSSKSSRRQKMAAQLAVRKNTPDTAAQGVGEGGASVGVRGLDVKQQQQQQQRKKKKIIIRKWSLSVFLLQNLSQREKSYGAKSER